MTDFGPDDFEIDEEFIEPDNGFVQQGHVAPSQIPEPAQTQQVGSERLEQRRFTGGDTLDEPVLTTIMRDVRGFGRMLRQTLGWKPTSETKEWDLWGPLLFCLGISLLLSLSAPGHQMSLVFSAVFSVLWLGQAFIAINIRLLGGSISFLRALCITGYSLFPLVIAALMSWIVKLRLVRLLIAAVMIFWAIWSASRGLGSSGVLSSRMLLASYPVSLFYIVIGWLCVVT